MKAAIAGPIAALLLAACGGDPQVAGTSSGVDNPALTVAFLDAGGTAMRITGDVNVYAQDQNPALDPEPLVTVKVRNSAFTNLTAADFARVQQTAMKRSASALSKTAAAGSVSDAATDSSVTAFNIILKTQDRTGSLLIGLAYDSASRKFARVGGDALTRVDLNPKPLVRYEAKMARDSLHGEAGRIFVPGTPFLATLVDSTFIIEDLPEGVFPIRLMAADGKVYPIGDSLDTKDSSLIYHPLRIPLGTVDTTAAKDTLTEFSVMAGNDQEAFVELAALLEAKLIGHDMNDPRLTLLWRQLVGATDSTVPHEGPKDSLLPPKPGEIRKASILNPTSLRTEVRFPSEGVYAFEIAATLGLRTRTDTLKISVRRLPPPPRPRIIQPAPGDSLRIGVEHIIQWEMPDQGKGSVSVLFSVDGGATWNNLIWKYMGLPYLSWTPDKSLPASSKCLIQVTNDAAPDMQARMEGPFNLL